MARYDAPALTELGSLSALTLQGDLNKIGKSPDIYSQVVPIIGDITPIS